MSHVNEDDAMHISFDSDNNEDELDSSSDYQEFLNFIQARPLRDANGNIVIQECYESDPEEVDRWSSSADPKFFDCVIFITL